MRKGVRKEKLISPGKLDEEKCYLEFHKNCKPRLTWPTGSSAPGFKTRNDRGNKYVTAN